MKHIQIIMPEVKECSAQSCEFNDDYECMADEVVVAYNNSKANCQTYAHR